MKRCVWACPVLSPVHQIFYVILLQRVFSCAVSLKAMFSRGWRFGWNRYREVDLFTDRHESSAETLSQAIRAAASEDPEADGSVLFGHLQGTVVGLRYYTGVVNPGEMVGLVRQPQNPYDRNAVMVANIYGNQVGHIKKELAAAMAHVMDNNLAKVEGVVHSGTRNSFTMPVMLSFWGREENRKSVTELMARRGYKLNTSGSALSGVNPKSYSSTAGQALSFKKGVTVPLTAEELKNAFDNLFEDLMESKDGEKGAAKAVCTPLLPHQKQALSWMCARENKSALPPFWEKRGELYYNSVTGFSAKEIPERLRGGILADDMGLGKTLTTIALILTNFHEGKPLPVDESVKTKSSCCTHCLRGCCCCCREHAFVGWAAEKCASIILPYIFFFCLQDQFEQHVHANKKVKVYLYYGTERNRSQKFLSSQDVVITTYNVISADFGNKSPLHGINWLRVVLDEGHIIRNPNAQMSKAVLQLKAHRRWILSGTPIQNSVKDLWMLLAFLRLKPFDAREWWNRVIQRPVTQGDRAGLKNLQTLVKCITLRRTKSSKVKGRPLVSLPEKSVYVEQVELSQAEREEYELARNDGKNIIGRYVAEGTVLKHYADVLVILMRLRQHCCHPDLLTKTSSDLGAAATPAELRERLIEKLRLVLASGSDEECSVCLDSVHLPVITHCAHVYCRPCIAQVISTEQNARCPLCRSEIKTSELVEYSEETEDENSGNSDKWRTSSKVQALMGNLLRLRSEDGSRKCLVVSQFTRKHGFTFVRLDGSLTQKRRTQVIKEFQSAAADSPTVMLLSLKAGGVGLNLTAASHVFLMDPAWNPAAEEQCIDRCHRLGQKRNVVVTKFIVKDSVEENMVKIQRQKQDLLEKAFGSSDSDRSKSRIDDIRALMEL
uniref:Helicase-like transcription factor n=1 Tax=Salarias fasciatus TaxID=181472 RepID=A0A672JGR7_SALFA